jgi:hypothetical protein
MSFAVAGSLKSGVLLVLELTWHFCNVLASVANKLDYGNKKAGLRGSLSRRGGYRLPSSRRGSGGAMKSSWMANRYLGHRSWSANAGHIFRREPSSAVIEHCHDSPAH